MTCDAHIRPFSHTLEVGCEEEGEHPTHKGVIRDYAYPGSQTVLQWMEEDRRCFHGEWPGDCPGCILPLGHLGDHTT
jgi:hypothetical protein